MAKAILKFSRIGNDGYDYALREDGVWFVREGVMSNYGWIKTKWRETEVTSVIETCLKGHEEGSTCVYVGFGHPVIITNGKGLRLP